MVAQYLRPSSALLAGVSLWLISLHISSRLPRRQRGFDLPYPPRLLVSLPSGCFDLRAKENAMSGSNRESDPTSPSASSNRFCTIASEYTYDDSKCSCASDYLLPIL